MGVSDLHWIWILSKHRFTEPALQWIPLTVSVWNVSCKVFKTSFSHTLHSTLTSVSYFRYHLQQCADIYNLSTSLDDVVQQTNEEYGGYDIRSTRIVFPNGSTDPWHALGVTKDITDDLPAVFIKGQRSNLCMTSINIISLFRLVVFCFRNGSLR